MAGAERQVAAKLSVGDRAQLTVRGTDREIPTAIVKALKNDPAVAGEIIPTPAGLEVRNSDFGDVSVVQDFIVAVGAGLTVEGLVAIVKAALSRSESEEESPLREKGLNLTVKTQAPGIVEIEITIFDSRT